MIGRPLARREDERILRGLARYVDDLEPSGTEHVAFVRSPFAHARVGAISAPPSVELITAEELRGRVRPFPLTTPPGATVASEPHPILAEEEVRYAGQPVAAVVAASRALAEDAAELVDVDYEPLEAVTDAPSSDLELMRWGRRVGDVEHAFALAEHTVTGHYELPRLVAAPIEPRGCLISHDPRSDELTVSSSVQDPHRPRAQLAHILQRPAQSIRVVVPDVGGAFGSKGVVGAEVAAVAAMAEGRGAPLKWTEDRWENFLSSYQGRGTGGELELALDGSGRMLALRARLWADLGAYLYTTTAIPPHTMAMLITGCYAIPAVDVLLTGRRTHKVPTGPYRGAGRPDAAYMLERLIDDAARATGIDRLELRWRNLIEDFPHETALGHSYDSGDYRRCLETAASLNERARRRAGPPPGMGHRASGSGVAMYVERAGGQWEAAEIELTGDGAFVIASSASPHGQGHETTFAQIAAEGLGCPPERIAFRFGDSAIVPEGVGTFGSRSAAMAGSAVAQAVEELIELGRRAAADRLGAGVEEVVFASGRFSTPTADLGWSDLGRGLHARARFASEPVFSSGAHAATVEIDPATGRLEVLSLAAVDDAGSVINPRLVRGQVLGGAVQALGECLVEEAVYDEAGQMRSASLLDYSLLTAAEIPPIVVGEVSSPTPLNPLGVKGAGEGGAVGALPAVANAVADALGGTHVDPPFTARKLWLALHGDGG